jgi:hypothetical protein
MRGPVGSTVRLKFLRKGVDNPMEVTLVREQVQIRAVRARVEANDLAYTTAVRSECRSNSQPTASGRATRDQSKADR